MINLMFFESSSKYGVVKATVHKTGKLGFSSGASKYMKLENFKYFKVGVNKDQDEDDSLYLVPVNSEDDKSFNLVKAGDYYYIHIKNILMELNIDYKKKSVIYDIEKIEQEENVIFKLSRREKP